MVSPNCGTDPVELLAYFETGFDMPQELSEEFTKQFPNVTWNIRQDQFANLMQQTPRCCSRATTRRTSSGCRRWSTWSRTACCSTSIRTSTAYGWDKWPPAELVAEPRQCGRPARATARSTPAASTTA